jgi:uncharacterized Tic20 family protein
MIASIDPERDEVGEFIGRAASAGVRTVMITGGSFVFFLCSHSFILFVFVKLGLAPFFYWKVLLLKVVLSKIAYFYVIFYFTAVFLFFVKVLLCCLGVLLASSHAAYIVLIAAVVTLYAFNTPAATASRFLAYSSAINGALVIALCMVALV